MKLIDFVLTASKTIEKVFWRFRQYVKINIKEIYIFVAINY